jgi:hypothetical protein
VKHAIAGRVDGRAGLRLHGYMPVWRCCIVSSAAVEKVRYGLQELLHPDGQTGKTIFQIPLNFTAVNGVGKNRSSTLSNPSLLSSKASLSQ